MALCAPSTVLLPRSHFSQTEVSTRIPSKSSCNCHRVSRTDLLLSVFFFCFFSLLYCLLSTIQPEKKEKKKKVCVVVLLQCHFVRELFSYLSVQIISNASANCFNVSTCSKQRDSFSANLRQQQLSVSIIRS